MQGYAPKKSSAKLRSLTCAALALPGLTTGNVQAASEDDTQFNTLYGYYQEGTRPLANNLSYSQTKLKPIHVDNLSSNFKTRLNDDFRLTLDFQEDTWSGATPLVSAPENSFSVLSSGASIAINSLALTNKTGDSFYRYLDNGQITGNKNIVHMMSMASPETRKQGSAKLDYDWSEGKLALQSGTSQERDYVSSFIGHQGTWYLNQKNTTLNWSTSYTFNSINALRDPRYTPYLDYSTLFDRNFLSQRDSSGGLLPLKATRDDFGLSAGISQLLNKNAFFNSSLSYTRSTGFLENPYKGVELLFINPNQRADRNGLVTGNLQAVAERRPDIHHQFAVNNQFTSYLPALDASFKIAHNFSFDDWGIQAHSFETQLIQPLSPSWTVSPSFRFYTQSNADFYKPYFVVNSPITYDKSYRPDYSSLPYTNFSSDQRLAAFGAMSAGINLKKTVNKGLAFNLGFEYYQHNNAWTFFQQNDGNFSNFDYYLITAGIDIKFSAHGGGMFEHQNHHQHSMAHMASPAGVQFNHLLSEDQSMIGYRYMFHIEGGDVMRGSQPLNNQQIFLSGCSSNNCLYAPAEHAMHMHMFDIMYAPTDWMTLMLMPQLVDMSMTLDPLVDNASSYGGGHSHGGNGPVSHSSGGLADTGLYSLFKLYADKEKQLILSIGGTAPTGNIQQFMSDGSLLHYGMQLGSGTWDLKPSLSFTQNLQDFMFGAQVTGTQRLQSANSDGYRLGNQVQSSSWLSYNYANFLYPSVRILYTHQEQLTGTSKGLSSKTSPVDYVQNYGGDFWDIGFGVGTAIDKGILKGQHFSVEWLQPLASHFNGTQLDRIGALNVNWSYNF